MKSRELPQVKRPWEKDDIMKKYRESINTVESANILKEVKEKSKKWAKKDLKLY